MALERSAGSSARRRRSPPALGGLGLRGFSLWRWQQSLLDDLAEKYGMYSSWATWNPANPADARIIAEHQSCLKASVVMIGLNVSRPIPNTWQNFHGR